MSPEGANNGWSEWRQHVLLELKRLNSILEKYETKTVDISVELSRLKVWSGIYGGVSGTIVTIVLLEVIKRW